jgi:hypothetical protein
VGPIDDPGGPAVKRSAAADPEPESVS